MTSSTMMYRGCRNSTIRRKSWKNIRPAGSSSAGSIGGSGHSPEDVELRRLDVLLFRGLAPLKVWQGRPAVIISTSPGPGALGSLRLHTKEKT